MVSRRAGDLRPALPPPQVERDRGRSGAPGAGLAVGPERVVFRAETLTKFDVAPDGRFILQRTR